MRTGVMVALGSAALFGISTPLAKMLVGSVSPLVLAGLLYAGSGLGLMLVLLGRRLFDAHASFARPQRADWLWLAAAIFFGGVAGPVALMYGLVASAASTASLLLNLEALFTALLAWFLFRENFDRRVMLGMLGCGRGRRAGVDTRRNESCLLWFAVDRHRMPLLGHRQQPDAQGGGRRRGDHCRLEGNRCWRGQSRSCLAIRSNAALAGVLGAAMTVGFLGYGVSLVLFVMRFATLEAREPERISRSLRSLAPRLR